MSGWELTNKAREDSGPRVQAFLRMIDREEADELRIIDLSASDFSPFTLCEYLEELGYEQGIQDDNGWELNFWIPFRKDGHTPVQVSGAGIAFELELEEIDFDWKAREREHEDRMKDLCAEVVERFKKYNTEQFPLGICNPPDDDIKG